MGNWGFGTDITITNDDIWKAVYTGLGASGGGSLRTNSDGSVSYLDEDALGMDIAFQSAEMRRSPVNMGPTFTGAGMAGGGMLLWVALGLAAVAAGVAILK